MNRTKHGVRDLNGPKMDGKYNGRSHCNHLRIESVPRLEAVEGRDKIRTVKVDTCVDCGCVVDFTMRETKPPEAQGDAEASP